MPLYKTKTQNYSNSAETDTSTENTFKIPSQNGIQPKIRLKYQENTQSQNGIQLYRNTRKTHQKASQENTPTLEKQFRKIPSEFKLSIIKQSNGSLRRNSPKFVNRRNRLTENNLSNQPTVNNNTKILRNKTKYRKDISKRINKNLNCTPESKSIHSKLDFNNNINDEILNKSELNTKSSKNLKQTNQHDTSSELDEMIISLWSQDVVPSNEPPKFSSHYEKLLWLQEQRNVGLYVCCDRCDKYRYLKDTVDPLELPNKWYCQMNPDKEHNKCSDPEVPLKSWQEADLIYNTYHAGRI
ncbi:CW-type Zinc Finger [Popillia japonica]|uniref:CW-type Zinc Finger n=1 Tax=Popillia japonica TaxID=7064 RepID=A0AAW1KQS5_POPJA